MDKLIFNSNWNIVKGKLKQQFSKLTDSDLKYIVGKEEELIGRIQKRLGKSRAEILRMLRYLTNMK